MISRLVCALRLSRGTDNHHVIAAMGLDVRDRIALVACAGLEEMVWLGHGEPLAAAGACEFLVDLIALLRQVAGFVADHIKREVFHECASFNRFFLFATAAR
jgi:hypothetical protein